MRGRAGQLQDAQEWDEPASAIPDRGASPEVISRCYTHLAKDDAYEAIAKAFGARQG